MEEYWRTLDIRKYKHADYYYFKALASYRNEQTNALIERTIDKSNPNKYHLDFINQALGKYPDNIHKNLMIKLWEEHYLVSESSFNYLKSEDEELTYSLIENYLSDFEKVYSGSPKQEIIPVLLPFAIEFNRNKTIELIANNLKTNSVTPFKEFMPFAIEIKSPMFIDPLFFRIENEWNGNVVYAAAEIIVSYGDKNLNNRILEASRKNKKVVTKYTKREDVEADLKRIIKGK